jgi:hypothetical protein
MAKKTEDNVKKPLYHTYIDNGNFEWKGLNGGLIPEKSQFSSRNILKSITDAEFERLGNGDTSTKEVARIAYTPKGERKPIWTRSFAFGGVAIRQGGVSVTGVKRYTPDYAGVAMAYMVSNLYQDGHDFCVVALSAPSVRNARNRIEESYLGKWVVEQGGKKTKTLNVLEVKHMEEVTGGMWLRTIDKDRNNRIALTGRDMVIDIGGGTTEFMLVENGSPKFDTVRSVKLGQRDIGVNQILSTFSEALTRNKEIRIALEEGLELDDSMVYRAFMDKSFYIPYKTKAVEVSEEFEIACEPFITALTNLYQQAGGLAMDRVFTTGGGGYLLATHLRKPFRRENQTLEFIDPSMADFPQFANVRGAQRFVGYAKNKNKLQVVEEESGA